MDLPHFIRTNNRSAISKVLSELTDTANANLVKLNLKIDELGSDAKTLQKKINEMKLIEVSLETTAEIASLSFALNDVDYQLDRQFAARAYWHNELNCVALVSRYLHWIDVANCYVKPNSLTNTKQEHDSG